MFPTFLRSHILHVRAHLGHILGKSRKNACRLRFDTYQIPIQVQYQLHKLSGAGI